MTGPELIDWRISHHLTQAAASRMLRCEARSIRRWEEGKNPIPEQVAGFCAKHPAPPYHGPTSPPPVKGIADHVASALKEADDYIEAMKDIPRKYGRACPSKWARSFWFEGACRYPIVHWGPGGLTPCPAALVAARVRLAQSFDAGELILMLDQLDDCHPSIRRKAAEMRGTKTFGAPPGHASI